MSEFLYETHLHTACVSACGVTEPEEYVENYKKAGYAGIIVTDHFFNGNCAIDDNLPWKEKVNLFCSGYERVLKSAENQDFDVFMGFEYNFDCDEFLIYGLDKEWLLSHPECEQYTHLQLFDEVNKAGGLMIQAHPYRVRPYIKQIHLHPECVHGIEIYNTFNQYQENIDAEKLAADNNLAVTSGSDMHDVRYLSKLLHDDVQPTGGVIFEKRMQSVKDFVETIKSKQGYHVRKSKVRV